MDQRLFLCLPYLVLAKRTVNAKLPAKRDKTGGLAVTFALTGCLAKRQETQADGPSAHIWIAGVRAVAGVLGRRLPFADYLEEANCSGMTLLSCVVRWLLDAGI